MVVFPNAKINIGLAIGEKREDGFHNLETLFCPVPLFDVLEFIPSDGESDSLTVTGNKLDCHDCDNLVLKASSLLHERYDFPYHNIHLHKTIPSGSGMGGGSSDAVFLLQALNKQFRLNISDENMKDIALNLGSDCPFFLYNRPQFATGRGDILRESDLKTDDLFVIIVHQGIHIPTAGAFSNLERSDMSGKLPNPSQISHDRWRDTIFNDFEEYAFTLYPQLAEIKESLYNAGAFYSSMTGSGSAIYGLFNREPAALTQVRGNIIYNGRLKTDTIRTPSKELP